MAEPFGAQGNEKQQREEAIGRGLSARGARIAEGSRGLLDEGFGLYLRDPFDAERNPRGILNFGTSENKLCFDLIEERLSKPDMNYLEPHLLQYLDTQGLKSLREEVAKFLTEYANASTPLDPDHIIVMNGCCAVFATLSTVLCDPGVVNSLPKSKTFLCILILDGYLIPAPYYGGINSKTWLYGGMQPVHVPLFSEVTNEESQPFQLTVEKLEAAYQRAKEQGIRVRALILINPHNPLGDIYPEQLLKECLEFAHRYKLHVIMDEIYMLSIYDDSTFTSILSLERWAVYQIQTGHTSCGDLARILGCVASELEYYTPEITLSEKQLISWLFSMDALDLYNMFLNNSLVTEFCHIFTLTEWLDNVFFPTNRRRLKEAQNILVDGLAEIGIPVLKSSGGLYVWADFRKFLKSQTFEAEMDLWWRILDGKLLISPGKAFCCYEPGWFRLVFSDSVDKIYLCIQRLQQMLHDKVDKTVPMSSPPKENECTDLDDSILDDYINTSVDDVSEGYAHMKKIVVF
ncbi:hypothetical protein JD844_003187 [Phrynosoma platyrhinos]|uniref:Aminotransferase class I/classII large domain-containing protein n=1 Tax=Phrynosoma platyrhinos TaxID=52577 RepID=A0ABQ7TCL7_PHRPL|nr:hypothetical protein JD844_003187 [Phrynosoma platyrhinos]